MKTKFSKFLRAILAVICLGVTFQATAEPPLRRFVPFEVERLKCWAPEYLTVTRIFLIRSEGVLPLRLITQYDFWDGEPIWYKQLAHEKDGTLNLGTVITAIDGHSTRA